MRRFCRSVDIKDINFIKRCIRLWLDEKKNRKDVQKFLSFYSGLTYQEIKESMYCEDYWFLEETTDRIAKDVQQRIFRRKLDLPPIRFKRKYDEACCKWRIIGIQKPIHQIFDYIAVEGCREMFEAKIGPYQMASLPGGGQEKGARTIYRWLQLDEKHTRAYAKADVRQCYPSIDHDLLKSLFARDLKNPELLWLVYELIDAFPEGLSIGSYFSQYACNYFLSKAYHFASEQLFKERKKRNGSIDRTRLIYKQLFYMDDILFLGSSQKDVEKGMELFGDFLRSNLKLSLKQNWKSGKADYIGKDGKHHGEFIDMMGYRIYRDHITVRRRTFKRMRRTILRAEIKMNQGEDFPLDMAYRIISHAGKIEHSDAYEFSKKHNLHRIKSKAEKIISSHDKALAEEKKRRKLLYENHNRTLPDYAGGASVQSAEGWDCRGVDSQEYTESNGCPF